jgi:hypothetical protein
MRTDFDPDDAVAIDHAPTRQSSIAAVAAGVLAALATVPFALLALPVAFGGITILAAGLFVRPSRPMVSIGTAGLFLSVLVAGGFGAPVEFLLFGGAATVIAWDLGGYAIDLGEQVGRHGDTARNETIHASISVVVALAAAAVGYAVSLVAGGGRPMAAVATLLFGIVFLVWAVRT